MFWKTPRKLSLPEYTPSFYAVSGGFYGSGIWSNAYENSVVYADKWAVGYIGTESEYLDLRDDTVGIGDYAFEGRWGFTGNLIIPNSVKYIGNNAFNGCMGFTGNLIIPNSVTSIRNGAFKTTGFTAVTIHSGVTSIGNGAFDNCQSLISVTFQGTIASSNFSSVDTFPGNLRDKFYAADLANGTPGTYTRVGNTWTMQEP